MEKYKIGYTQGVYDLFHIGHLNLLKNAKSYCDYLIVGINSDLLVKQYKDKNPIYSEIERKEIVGSIKYVDEVIIVNTLDKEEILKQISFDAIFIGSDWKGNERWIETEKKLKIKNIDTIYLPHTDGVSSTLIKDKIKK